MDISKLSRLFSTDFGQQTRKQSAQNQPKSTERRQGDDDAVKLSGRLQLSNAATREPSAQTRAQRVEALREQVQAGEYKQPDTATLAQVVTRELFVV